MAGAFVDAPNLPKVGYIANSPDLSITNLQDVYPQKQADYSIMGGTNGSHRVVPSHPLPALAVQLHVEDSKRFTALTQRALDKRLLVMLGSEPLSAPWVRAPIEADSFTIGFRDEAELKKTERELKKLIH
jgi:preprotein translocase subunit SecD